jgi:hypothetical protein
MQLRLFSGSFSAVLAILGAAVSVGSLTGCSSAVVESHSGTGGTSGYEGQGINGKALVGQQPLIGASVELYAAGTSGNGASGVGLVSNALITDSTGAFTVPAGYNCPSADSQIYRTGRAGTDSPDWPFRGALTRVLARGRRQVGGHLYDPDGIRSELMEFQASREAVLSPFLASTPTR